MTADWFDGIASGQAVASRIDTSVAHSARVYNCWLGGKDNFAADREAAAMAAEAYPEIIRGVRHQRAFLARAVDYLAAATGVRQFLDIGTGLPAADNTHEVAQRADPSCRIVYADNDPIVLAHARALLASAPGGVTDYLDADFRDTAAILAGAQRTLDFTRPVALMLVGILQLIPDDDDPHRLVASYLERLPPGSWLAIAHPTGDIQNEQVTTMASRLNTLMTQKSFLRSRAEITRLFDGLELLEPGVVPLNRWRPGAAVADEPDVAAYCGLARKG